MSLFSTNAMEEPAQPSSHTLVMKRSKTLAAILTCDSYLNIQQVLTEIKQDQNYILINYGTWSMLHLLIYLMQEFTGPGKIWITTWSVNEDVIKNLTLARDTGLIKEINFLFDFRVRKYRPGAFFMAKENFNARITSCHAKMTVIRGEKMDLTILGSANYTRNNRIESMIIFPGKHEADEHEKWISERFEHANDN